MLRLCDDVIIFSEIEGEHVKHSAQTPARCQHEGNNTNFEDSSLQEKQQN